MTPQEQYDFDVAVTQLAASEYRLRLRNHPNNLRSSDEHDNGVPSKDSNGLRK